MIQNIIRLDVKPGMHNELRASGDKVSSYGVYVDRKDETIAYSLKTFQTEADLQAHNDSDALKAFLCELKELLEGGADYHECTEVASL